VRHGFQIGEEAHARVYGKFDYRGEFEPLAPDTTAHDDWRMFRTGTRADWRLPDDHLTLQGDFYYGELGQRGYQPAYVPPLTRVVDQDVGSRGGNALGRWTRAFDDGGELQVQTYYDRFEQHSRYFDYVLDTFDVSAQHRLPLPARNELVYGLGYRLASDDTDRTKENLVFAPPERQQHLFSVFAQNEWEAVPERLRLIAGAKLEHHDFIGWQLQPSARLAWTPDERNTVWTAVSRAVRSPSRTERDIILNLNQQGTAPNGLPIFPRGFGSDAFGEEVLTAYELGWRARVFSWAAFDLTGFYFDYDDLGSAQVGAPFFEAGNGVPRLIVPLTAINGAAAESAGFEAAFDFEVDPALRFRAGYSLLHIDVDNPTFAGGGKDPEQQFFLRGSLDLPGDVQFDAWARYVDGIPGIAVPAYFEVDLRLAWQATRWLEVAVVGQNLCSPDHQEFVSPGNTVTQATAAPRSVYGQFTLRF
ncbi:MAG TPA: TonB-dependent receptor, partial [Verrucomicrobiota bacterium]|nr:TonB-dependent receptor [Verrucomicrobiota bacterium]